MLRIEYQQSLVEAAVLLAARKDESMECELHLAIDPLYEIQDEELRQRAFVPIFGKFFARLGLGGLVSDLIAERPLISEHIDRCLVREAAREKAECADMFVRHGEDGAPAQPTLVIQACPESLVNSARFVPRMRRELLHVADMLDDRFGYDRESLAGMSSRHNLLRDRYRVLWDVYVEGRLEREGRGVAGEAARLQQAVGRVFANQAAGLEPAAFRRVFDTPDLTHDKLLGWAGNPERLLDPQDVEREAAEAGQAAATTSEAISRRLS